MAKKNRKGKGNKPLSIVVGVLVICYLFSTCKGGGSTKDNTKPDNQTTSSAVASETDAQRGKAKKEGAGKNEEEQKKSTNTDLELITAKGHPALYGSTAEAHSVWGKAEENKVVFPGSNQSYSDETIILMDGYSQGENNSIIRKFEIYFQNCSKQENISLRDALKIAKGYYPKDIVNQWYEFNRSECLKPTNQDSDKDTCYIISYGLTDEGSKAYYDKKHSYSGSIDFVFYGKSKEDIDCFTVGFGLPRWMSSADKNGYEFADWKYQFDNNP